MRTAFDFFAWKGALGGARLAEDENGYMKVKYFLSPEKCNKLPEWEGTLPTRQSITAAPEDDFDDLPF